MTNSYISIRAVTSSMNSVRRRAITHIILLSHHMSKDSLFLPYPVQVLTRRDQLKLKQTQDLEKKNAEKAEKPKAKGKAKGKSKAKAKSKVNRS